MVRKTNTNLELLAGIEDALPIVLGYMPIGFAYGVLAMDAGLSILEVVLMSILVYAGSAQFIAVGLLASGASAFTIVVTTFLVNSRHLLMSASLVPYIRHFNPKLFPFVSFGITDEAYGVALSRYNKRRASPEYMLGLNLTSQTSWVLSSLLGGVLGAKIGNPEAFGLNFALPAMFIALLVFQLKDTMMYLVGIIAGLVSVTIALIVPGNLNIILATIAAATIGTITSEIIDR